MNLIQLGWNSHFADSAMQISNPHWLPARVAREDRGGYVVYTDHHAWRATVCGAMRHQARTREDFPAVGDWVLVQPRQGEAAAVIHRLLPRKNAVSRKAAGTAVEVQVIAANVDLLLICCGLDRDFNLRRIERYLTLAYNCGVAPGVVLTKADLCPDLQDCLQQASQIAIGVPAIAVSVCDGRGLAELRSWIPVGHTAAFVGSSGVGKSTIMNALLQEAAMKVGQIRARDGRGRHTTTHRQLLLLPSGGMIIDTPGMRELQLWGDETGLGSSFSDIDDLAGQCKFRDCAHQAEPGCAVRRAIDNGTLEPNRLSAFQKQQAELRWQATLEDPLVRAEERAKWKAIHKSARKWMDQKYRY